MHSALWKPWNGYQGHFYNWYDTLSLKPLPPTYVSTVDSGNLAADLMTLRPGLLALPDQKILGTRLFDGLSDTLRILVDAAGGAASAQLAQLQKDLASACDYRPTTLTAARLCLDRLVTSAAEVVGSLDGDSESLTELRGHAPSPGNARTPSMS